MSMEDNTKKTERNYTWDYVFNEAGMKDHDQQIRNSALDEAIAEIDKKRSIRFEARELSIVAGTDNITDELSKEIAVLNDLKSALLKLKTETKSG